MHGTRLRTTPRRHSRGAHMGQGGGLVELGVPSDIPDVLFAAGGICGRHPSQRNHFAITKEWHRIRQQQGTALLAVRCTH